METLTGQVFVALVLLAAFFLLPPARPRDEVDDLAERKARELGGRDV